jgi:two-component system cell cycle response regulator
MSEVTQAELIAGYEKKIFDLTQLIEISKSLNSSLDYNALIQSILYICMGQLKLLKAGLFVRRDIGSQDLVLHRSQVGFDISPGELRLIPEGNKLIDYLHDSPRSHSMQELITRLDEDVLKPISDLEPSLIVPLRAKDVINGVLVLGDPIGNQEITREDREYVESIAILAGIAVHNAFLYEVTTTDMMTRLRLRHFFLDTLGSQLALCRRNEQELSIIMIDIDNFKSLNDGYGHLMGDEVIIGVSRIMLGCIRQTDMAARYGGEEFVILLPGAEEAVAVQIAERIRQSVEQTSFSLDDASVSVTISLGLASFDPLNEVNSQHFIDNADQALYRSKRGGKNRVTVYRPNEGETND